MEGGEEIDGLEIALRHRLAVFIERGLASEILHQQEAVLHVGSRNAGSGKAPFAQEPVDSHEGFHILGQMSDLRIGQAVAHRRAVRATGRVHQDQAAVTDSLIGSGRGVTEQELALRTLMAAGVEKSAGDAGADKALDKGAGSGDLDIPALAASAQR